MSSYIGRTRTIEWMDELNKRWTMVDKTWERYNVTPRKIYISKRQEILFFLASCLNTTTLQVSSSLQRTLRGPGYPFNYSNNALYCWRIYAPTGYVVKLTISSLSMEVCPRCSCDSIQIFDGFSEISSSLGKFCSGSWKRTSSGRYLYLKFTSDATGTGTAFTVYYYRTKGKDNFLLNFRPKKAYSSLQLSVQMIK